MASAFGPQRAPRRPERSIAPTPSSRGVRNRGVMSGVEPSSASPPRAPPRAPAPRAPAPRGDPEQISALIARLHAKCMERARKQAQLEIMEARLEKGREKGDFEKDKGAPKRHDDAPARP